MDLFALNLHLKCFLRGDECGSCFFFCFLFFFCFFFAFFFFSVFFSAPSLLPPPPQVVLLYHDYLPERDSRLWGRNVITSPWLRTNSKSEAVQKLDKYYNLQHSPARGFWVTQGVLTPSANDIIWGVASSLRTKLGVPMCQVIVVVDVVVVVNVDAICQ